MAWICTPIRSTLANVRGVSASLAVSISAGTMVAAPDPPMQALGGAPLAEQETRELIAAQMAPERRVGVARARGEHRRQVARQHAEAADHERPVGRAIDGAHEHVERPGAHEPLPAAVAPATGPDTVVAGTHRAQVHEPQRRLVPAAGDPAEHAAAVAVDAIPHSLAHETADRLEALAAIQLGHPRGHLVADRLGDEPAVAIGMVRLAAAGAEARLLLHALDQRREVRGRQFEV